MKQLSNRAFKLKVLSDAVVSCQQCPRLVAWRERVGLEKRAAFREESYWARPVPGFGDPEARLVVVGLAPAAHGANRTGRMFTGDRSGDWLYRALYRAGFASQPESFSREDGLVLTDAWVTSVVRCAPPVNKPFPEERDHCCRWLDEELDLLSNARVILCLGSFAYTAIMRRLSQRGFLVPKPRPRFEHGLNIEIENGPLIISSYHPSQQNTFTGRLSESMFDSVFAEARFWISRLV